MSITDYSHDQIVTALISVLPATDEELTNALAGLGVKAWKIPVLIRDARQGGTHIVRVKGTNYLAADVEPADVVVAEHRNVAYAATLLATTNGQMPDPRLAQAAQLVTDVLDGMDRKVKDARRLHAVQTRRAKLEAEEAELLAALSA